MNRPDKKEKMKAVFSNFDSDYNIQIENFTRYEIGFSATPLILEVNSTFVKISASLDNYGYIYAVAQAKAEDLGRPSPFQIAQGLNYKNIPIPSGEIEVDQRFVLFEMTVEDLDSDTDYNLYVSAGSAHPGYPDYMKASNIVFMEFKTTKAPVIPKLSLEYASIVNISTLLVTFLIALMN